MQWIRVLNAAWTMAPEFPGHPKWVTWMTWKSPKREVVWNMDNFKQPLRSPPTHPHTHTHPTKIHATKKGYHTISPLHLNSGLVVQMSEPQAESPSEVDSCESKKIKAVYANLRILKTKHNIRWSAGAAKGLDDKIEQLVLNAIARAKDNGRKTLKASDF